jgi:hypothetical protein
MNTILPWRPGLETGGVMQQAAPGSKPVTPGATAANPAGAVSAADPVGQAQIARPVTALTAILLTTLEGQRRLPVEILRAELEAVGLAVPRDPLPAGAAPAGRSSAAGVPAPSVGLDPGPGTGADPDASTGKQASEPAMTSDQSRGAGSRAHPPGREAAQGEVLARALATYAASDALARTDSAVALGHDVLGRVLLRSGARLLRSLEAAPWVEPGTSALVEAEAAAAPVRTARAERMILAAIADRLESETPEPTPGARSPATEAPSPRGELARPHAPAAEAAPARGPLDPPPATAELRSQPSLTVLPDDRPEIEAGREQGSRLVICGELSRLGPFRLEIVCSAGHHEASLTLATDLDPTAEAGIADLFGGGCLLAGAQGTLRILRTRCPQAEGSSSNNDR